MSLRFRLVSTITALLVLCLVVGLTLAGLTARQFLRSELSSGLESARLTVEKTLEDLPSSDHPERDLMALRAIFDGDRHVVASLLDQNGHVIAQSDPAKVASRPPTAFVALFRTPLTPVLRKTPTGAARTSIVAVQLTPTPEADLSSLWLQAETVIGASVVFVLLLAVMVYAVVGQALLPLRPLSDSLLRIGAGDYDVRVDLEGPSELVAVSRGFNQMAEQLASAKARNRQLEDQLLTLQDEERADFVRDLHDEIGPYLFAVTLDASMVERELAQGRPEAAASHLCAIKEAVVHMQREVRDLLGRLRPLGILDVGLKSAVTDVISFWRARFPQITFIAYLDGADALTDEASAEAAFHMVQEGLSNAIRHGRPRRIDIRIEPGPTGGVRVEILDDGQGQDDDQNGASPTLGYGLTGMRERITRCGGVLHVGWAEPAGGWRLVADLPHLAL